METINKPELIRIIAKKADTTIAKTEAIFDASLEVIMETLADGDKVKIVGFGSFEPRVREAYVGRNPKTGEDCEVDEKVRPFFIPGKAFKDFVNDRD